MACWRLPAAPTRACVKAAAANVCQRNAHLCPDFMQLDQGYTAPPAARPLQAGGRGRGRGRASDDSLVTVTGIFPRETVGSTSWQLVSVVCFVPAGAALVCSAKLRPGMDLCCAGEQGAAPAFQRALGQPQDLWAAAVRRQVSPKMSTRLPTQHAAHLGKLIPFSGSF